MYVCTYELYILPATARHTIYSYKLAVYVYIPVYIYISMYDAL